jgi:hypothetical protein
MGGSATAVATSPKVATKTKRRRATASAAPPPSTASTSAIPPLRPSRALIEHYLRYEGWTMRAVFTLDKDRTTGKRWEPSGAASAWGHPFTIDCYRDDDRFEREAIGALANIAQAMEIPVYQLGILASAEHLIGPRSPTSPKSWNTGFDAATIKAIAALFIMARVDRARWEATR